MINLIYLFPCVLHQFSKSCDIFFITKLQSLRKTLILVLSTLWQKVYDQLSYLPSELWAAGFQDSSFCRKRVVKKVPWCVCALGSASKELDWSPGRGCCVAFLNRVLHSYKCLPPPRKLWWNCNCKLFAKLYEVLGRIRNYLKYFPRVVGGRLVADCRGN